MLEAEKAQKALSEKENSKTDKIEEDFRELRREKQRLSKRLYEMEDENADLR